MHPADIDDIDWNKVVGCNISEDGAEGVCFVELENKKAVVVKGSSTAASDYFAYVMASRAGVSIPKMRMIRQTVDIESQPLWDNMARLFPTMQPMARSRARRCLERPCQLVMEFVPATALVPQNLDAIFGPVDAAQPLHDNAKAVFMELGKIGVLDIVINNYDRIPLIWDNDGNLQNILFHGQRNHVAVAIDFCVTAINPAVLPANFEEYLNKVKYLINEMARNHSLPEPFKNVPSNFTLTCFEMLPSVQNLAKCFNQNLQRKLHPNAIPYFTRGIALSMQEFAKISRTDIVTLHESIAKNLEKVLELLRFKLDSVGYNKINIDFLDGVISVFREASPVLASIIALTENLHKQDCK